MKSNTYSGGIKPYEEIKQSQLRKQKSSSPTYKQKSSSPTYKQKSSSPTYKQKSASQRHKPTSDEISIEKSIDEIFLDVGKLNLSSYDEIEMIRERLLQLKTIQFYGVLEIPYLLSPSSGDEDKATSIGGAPKKNRAQGMSDIETKLESKEELLEQITQSTSKDEINKLYTKFVEISKEILNFRKDSALKSDGKIDFSKLEKEDKEA